MRKMMLSVGIALVGMTACKTTKNNVVVANDNNIKKMIAASAITKDINSTTLNSKSGLTGHLAFYKAVLKGIGANITPEKIKFLEAWRRGEGGKAKNNPFNTTKDVPGTADTKYNSHGVRNYPDMQTGLAATIATLKLGHYKGIVALLKKDDVKAKEIAHCPALKKWGTGDMVKKVLAKGKINVPASVALA
jgi:hypothetical protein